MIFIGRWQRKLRHYLITALGQSTHSCIQNFNRDNCGAKCLLLETLATCKCEVWSRNVYIGIQQLALSHSKIAKLAHLTC